nr:4-hydroxy-3-methylbut-2-enyl diphosphate reductase [Clostridia bacterium]
MIVIKGKNSGFCFGVKRAVETAFSLKEGKRFVLGEIIHNESVNKQLADAGVKIISSVDDEEIKRGDTVLIRTHGEPETTFVRLKEKGVKVVDCTCPFVNEIHSIVKKHYEQGYAIAIIGNKNHPEIVGINGWCKNSAVICENTRDLERIDAEKLCIVVQTTYSEEKFSDIIKNFARNKVKTVDIFNTICYTTTKRQKEADAISKQSDAVLVLGGEHSNNTNELFDICKGNCGFVYRIVNPDDFDYEKIKNFNKVGIVLGASTPEEQFREVMSHMANITEEIITTETVESEVAAVAQDAPAADVAVSAEKSEKVAAPAKSEMEAAFDKIRPSKDLHVGQIVKARISSATDEGLTLSVNNAKVDNFELPKEELLTENYNKDDYKDKIGEEIRVMVIAKKPLKFSEKKMEGVLKEEAEIEEIRNGKIFEAQITATNKGGLVGKFGSYGVFVPSSQIRMGFVKDLEKYVGKTLRLKAEKVESRGARRQIVGSQRIILEAEKAERDAIRAEKEAEFFANVQEGDVVLGTPVRFAAFGAFINVNGFDCLAHISDLSWTGCKECSDVLELGKEYEFKILKIDAENKKVSVGYKQLQPKPWDSVLERYAVGDVITGKVVRIVSFGAFVEVEKGIDGLVHVSQISNEWLENPVTALQVGQEITAKILDINVEKEKMTLSIKALLPEVVKPEKEEKGKGKKGAKEESEEGEDLHEWKDDDNGGVSIADILQNSDK